MSSGPSGTVTGDHDYFRITATIDRAHLLTARINGYVDDGFVLYINGAQACNYTMNRVSTINECNLLSFLVDGENTFAIDLFDVYGTNLLARLCIELVFEDPTPALTPIPGEPTPTPTETGEVTGTPTVFPTFSTFTPTPTTIGTWTATPIPTLKPCDSELIHIPEETAPCWNLVCLAQPLCARIIDENNLGIDVSGISVSLNGETLPHTTGWIRFPYEAEVCVVPPLDSPLDSQLKVEYTGRCGDAVLECPIHFPSRPTFLAGGYLITRLYQETSGNLWLAMITANNFPGTEPELYFAGTPSGIMLPLTGPNYFEIGLAVGPISQSARYLLEVRFPEDCAGPGATWPYLTIDP